MISPENSETQTSKPRVKTPESLKPKILAPQIWAPQILALDSSGDQASVALWQGDKLVGELRHEAKHGHAATLVPMAQKLMQMHGADFDALTHIAAGRGPGSFTGIRVALAAAKGFCLATTAAPIGVSVLAASANAAKIENLHQGCPMLMLADTRRGPLYAQLFDPDAVPLSDIVEAKCDDVLTQFSPDVVKKLSRFGAGGRDGGRDVGRLAVAGPMAADVVAALVSSKAASEGMSHFNMTELLPPDAGQIAALAAAQISDNQNGDNQISDPLTPLYLAPAFLGPKRAS